MEDAEEYLIEEIEEEKRNRPVIKNAVDLQRARLEKLMKNPDKPVMIPEAPKERDYMQSVPTFVRNVMGSSAGAGSGEFHVYRHLRRKEYARQKYIASKSLREQLDDDYRNKLEQNRMASEAKTAKKRAKRLKKKQKMKERGVKKMKTENSGGSKADNDNDVLSNTEDEEDESKSDDDSTNEDTMNPIADKQSLEEIVKNVSDKEDLQEDTKNNKIEETVSTIVNPTEPLDSDTLHGKNNDEKLEEIEKKSPPDKPLEEVSEDIEKNSVEDNAQKDIEVSTENEQASS